MREKEHLLALVTFLKNDNSVLEIPAVLTESQVLYGYPTFFIFLSSFDSIVHK